MENNEIQNILKTPIDDEDMYLTPLVIKLLKQQGIETFENLTTLTYQELKQINGIGKQTTFKICLRVFRFSPEAFLNTNLANSIEAIDERKFSQYNIVHVAVSQYKRYKKTLEKNELEI